MIFNSFNFIILYPLIFLLYYAIPARYGMWRNLFLLVTSYILYIQFKPVYALILLGVTCVTYYAALLIPKSSHPKRVMTVGVLLTLLPLVFFKYFNFINDSIQEVLHQFGLDFHLAGLNWAVPIGISFFTFQALSYVWDVYYKRQSSENDFLTYALYVSFFPSILSGPINRASLVIPQLKAIRPYFDYNKAVEGLKLLLWGMFMKVAVADRVGLYVDVVFEHHEGYTSATCFLASILYSIQIYADFAGYSLMALGVGKTLGFDLTENFRRPYFAVSITDFWHRWHISLSTWLRDYVYIPLGGSRQGKIKSYWNIFVTFLVSGIWHGANWTFIFWGILHGISQIVEKILNQQKCNKKGIVYIFRVLLTFVLVNFFWIFFRMNSITDACSVIRHIFDFSQPMSIFTSNATDLYFIILAVVILFIKDFSDEFFPNRFLVYNNRNRLIRWCGYIATLSYILIAGVFGAEQFIYANF